jgi:hypothetical protein
LDRIIHHTKNYDMFKFDPLTREIKEGTKKYLQAEASMIKHGHWYSKAIVVHPPDRSGKLTIVEGHHRFKIARKHGLTLYYIIDEQRVPLVQRENSGGRTEWNLADWTHSHLNADKNVAYKVLQGFHERTGIPRSTCLTLLTFRRGIMGGNNVVYEEVRDGTLRITDTTFAENVGDVVMFCTSLGVNYARKSAFVRAVSLVIRTGVATIEDLKKRMKQNVGLMKKKNINADYLSIINEVYNYRCYPKVDLKTEITNVLAEERRQRGAHMLKNRETKKPMTAAERRKAPKREAEASPLP